VIYTSGSTGEPKGVMIEHRGVVNFLASMQRDFALQNTDCLLAVTTISFDIAALELYLPLAHGAKVVLASRGAASDPQQLMGMIQEHEATVLQATPATWQLLLEGGWKGQPRMKALCGGESLTKTLSGRLVGRVQELWNLYGPTETTIWSCSCKVLAVPEGGNSVEAIGRPIANTLIRILDEQRRPVAIGMVGEIYIGGVGVARGYLNRPELTAERFVEDPFQAGKAQGSAEPQARMYRTGDLGRWRADGTIEYLGRNDQQVKIRGYRIELGEIEAQLLKHAQVKEAVVLAREDVPGQKHLVAYLTHTGEAPLIEVLREHLMAGLPEHMLPGAFVVLESLPLTPNGKLDRRALPAPDGSALARPEYEPPQGEIEEALGSIWQEVLRVARVGRQDNFFDLGGHSLLAVEVAARVEDRFSITVSVRDLFSAPVLHRLAIRISRELDELNQYRSVTRHVSAGTDGIEGTMEEIEL
jgi:amino acid adenylation domain-containing protein